MSRLGWSIDPQHWVRLREVAADLRWRKVILNSMETGSVPDKAGVYAICSRTNWEASCCRGLFGDCYSPLYVGQTGDLRRRFREHCGSHTMGPINALKRCYAGRLEFWFAEVPIRDSEVIEGLLIQCFGPPANRNEGRIRARLRDPMPAI